MVAPALQHANEATELVPLVAAPIGELGWSGVVPASIATRNLKRSRVRLTSWGGIDVETGPIRVRRIPQPNARLLRVLAVDALRVVLVSGEHFF